ncbi:hypothetical protein LLG95_13865 [bacterium]|nr:hypothetical protein [bacterium]
MMPDDRDKSLSRSLGKFALVSFLIVGFLILVGLGIICSLPAPDPALAIDAEKRYERVRTAFAAAPETGLPAEAPEADTTPTSPALQAKCDALFEEMLYSYDSACGETFDQNWVYSKLAKARELAALYDTGVRVSPATKKKYRLAHSYPIGQLATSLAHANDLGNQAPNEKIESIAQSIITAFKFINMIDCPSEHIHIDTIFDPNASMNTLDPEGHSYFKIPREYDTITPELVWPRNKPIDNAFYMALCLDRARERRKYFEKTLEPGFIYRKERERLDRRGARDVPDMVGNYFEALVNAIVYPHIDGPQNLKTMIAREKNLQDAAAAYQAKTVRLEELVQILPGSYETSARLLAAELELRRGVPVPSADRITTDSYFFDPLAQKPFKLCVAKESDKISQLQLKRPASGSALVRQYAGRYSYSVPDASGETLKIIRLPATHPGLDNLTTTTLHAPSREY